MIGFIDDHRAAYGVEPICRVLPIAPSTYRAHAAKRADPGKLSARARHDASLQTDIKRVWDANFQVYGVRKVWRQLQREAIAAPRCQVARLMKRLGLAGAVRGKTVKTTHSDKSTPCPLDRVNRQFRASGPNILWVSDFTYVATWQGFAYVAFVIDAFARRIVGWRVSRSARADFVLDALEQALCDRRPVRLGGLVHHSDRGVQYLSIRYSERLLEAGIEPSVGSVGDSYDNALAETINGLFKAEVIHRRGPWRSAEAVEFATLEWVDWFNNRRLLRRRIQRGRLLDLYCPHRREPRPAQESRTARHPSPLHPACGRGLFHRHRQRLPEGVEARWRRRVRLLRSYRRRRDRKRWPVHVDQHGAEGASRQGRRNLHPSRPLLRARRDQKQARRGHSRLRVSHQASFAHFQAPGARRAPGGRGQSGRDRRQCGWHVSGDRLGRRMGGQHDRGPFAGRYSEPAGFGDQTIPVTSCSTMLGGRVKIRRMGNCLSKSQMKRGSRFT
jgi:putative transposase